MEELQTLHQRNERPQVVEGISQAGDDNTPSTTNRTEIPSKKRQRDVSESDRVDSARPMKKFKGPFGWIPEENEASLFNRYRRYFTIHQNGTVFVFCDPEENGDFIMFKNQPSTGIINGPNAFGLKVGPAYLELDPYRYTLEEVICVGLTEPYILELMRIIFNALKSIGPGLQKGSKKAVVHGNITCRSVRMNYKGDVVLADFTKAKKVNASEYDVQATKDLEDLANLAMQCCTGAVNEQYNQYNIDHIDAKPGVRELLRWLLDSAKPPSVKFENPDRSSVKPSLPQPEFRCRK